MLQRRTKTPYPLTSLHKSNSAGAVFRIVVGLLLFSTVASCQPPALPRAQVQRLPVADVAFRVIPSERRVVECKGIAICKANSKVSLPPTHSALKEVAVSTYMVTPETSCLSPDQWPRRPSAPR
jgi:hypothetical protein